MNSIGSVLFSFSYSVQTFLYKAAITPKSAIAPESTMSKTTLVDFKEVRFAGLV